MSFASTQEVLRLNLVFEYPPRLTCHSERREESALSSPEPGHAKVVPATYSAHPRSSQSANRELRHAEVVQPLYFTHSRSSRPQTASLATLTSYPAPRSLNPAA